MSWSRNIYRIGLVVLALAAAPALSACSGFRPVYADLGGGGPAATDHAFAYGAPGSRLDQIIYTELRLRLGPQSGAVGAIDVAVRSSTSSRRITRTDVRTPGEPYEMTLTTRITVTGPDGRRLFSGTRSASAIYMAVGQVLADNTAQNEAAERAARSMADTVHLTVLGALGSAAGG